MKVLLLTIDAWRASHASFVDGSDLGLRRTVAAGCELTPHLASFARDGVAFSRAVAHGPATPYAFPSLFTSTLPLDRGGYERITADRTLLTEPLSDAGWTCTGVHSNPWLKAENGYGRGYECYADVGEFSLPLLERGRNLLHDRFETDDRVFRAVQRIYRRVRTPLRFVADAESEVDFAVGALSSAGDHEFVWVHLLTPHAPYEPPPRHQHRVGIDHAVSDSQPLVRRAQRDPESLTSDEKRTVRRLYAASVRHADEQIAALLSSVDDETLAIVTADHGEALFEHGQVGHEPALYDELLRVPLLIRPPGGTRARTNETLVRHADLAPTVLDYAGIEPPDSYEGRSLRPIVDGTDDRRTDDESGIRPAIAEVASRPGAPGRIDRTALQIVVRTADRKAYFDRGETRCFDLESDPRERRPVRDHPDSEWSELLSVLAARVNSIEETLAGEADASYDESTERRLRDLGYLE
ncbi:sulfatase [Natrarchaeobius halalkaliphilus]|uniref:Sulfatase n=1 Tax=Natrarchaeobius halalkaliphilus TaxID=1679091 RepID=A0A3N6P4U2_9EURY|nr:sulfatase-like hydrolase/transferase [Natrarchaeobius halalkaliphilus]RQG93019.1 sulfatase [Natrarchaeobius halalkaliphilus]